MDIIEKMSVSEKVIFGVFSAMLILSALTLFNRASNLFAIETPVLGGTLREGVVGYPRYINPLLPVTDSGRDLSNLIYSGLMKVNSNGALIPDLAKDYKISEDGLTYTFTLKDDIYFHDNVPVTASDIEFTVKKVRDLIIKSPKAVNWNGVTTKVIDQKTIEFILKKPYAPFIENTTLGILPQHIWKEVDSDTFLFSQFNFEPIGSGPYKIKDISRNTAGLPTYYHLVPFDKYALQEPYIADLYIYFFGNEDKLIEAYKNGAINSMSSISAENAKTIDTDKSKIIQTPLPRTYAVFLNQNQAKVFVDQTVREALKLATPANQIIQNVLLGFATPIESPLPKEISLIPTRTTTDEEGIDKAKALLQKAGWVADESGTLVKKDKKGKVTNTLAFSLATSNVSELKATAEILKTTWQKIGAKVDIKIFESGDLEQNVIVPRAYDALLFGEAIGRDVDLFPFWHSSERNNPGLNIAGYTNTKADKYLSDARATSDDKKRISLYQSFEKEVAKDIPAIFLYSPDLIYVVPKNIKGISLGGLISPSERFSNIEQWYIETENIWQIPGISK